MKSKLFWFLFVSSLTYITCCHLYSQEIHDTSRIWRIETSDGNEFFGTIVSEDDENIRLKTRMLGELTIPLSFVSTSEIVDQDEIKKGEIWMKNLQATRYFYSPNGFGLEKGAGYYQNMWVFYNQASYGLTKNFSMGIGLVPLFLLGGTATPAWITPKVSFPLIRDKLGIGAGALIGTVVGEDMGLMGITYGVITLGNSDRNITAGTGVAFTDGSWSDPVINLCGMLRIGKRGYLLTENYFLNAMGENYFILSGGGRTVWPKLSVDYGLFIPVNIAEVFVAIPWLSLTVPVGKRK